LNLQLELSSKPDLLGDAARPDFQSFTICIMAQADSESPQKVQRAKVLLDSLLERVASGDLRVTRNPTAPFSAVLSAIAKSKAKTPEMPDTISSEDGFNSVVDTQTDPYSIASSIYQDVQSDAHRIGTLADHHATSAFLRCVAAHCAPGSVERDNTARVVFEDACQTGQVSRAVLQALKVALGDGADSIPELNGKWPPKFWSRNVSGAFR
jgi:hypothetical protein